MSAKEIADEINKGKLYQKNDGSLVSASQVSIRINNYPHLFGFKFGGLVSRQKNVVADLHNIANRMQNNINKSGSFFGISIKQNHLLLPAIFFFKRLLDNPLWIKSEFKVSYFDFKFNYVGYSQFLNELNSKSDVFLGKLNDLMIDANNLPQLINEDLFLEELKDQNLSEKEIDVFEFGSFFNELIYNTGKQNFKMGEFYSPKGLSELFCCLISNNINQNTSIYNPAAGFATIPAILSQKSKSKFRFFGEEINQDVYLLAAMNLFANGIKTDHIQNADTFLAKESDSTYDYVFCVPPFIGKDKNKGPMGFPIETKDLNLLFIQKCALSLNKGGKAFVLVPEGFLINPQTLQKELRKFLFDSHLIEGIISLPVDLLHPYASVKTSILILSNKNNQNITFLDAENVELAAKNNKNINPKVVAEICQKYYSHIIDLFEDVGIESKASNLEPIRKLEKSYDKLQDDNYLLAAGRHLATEDYRNDNKTRLSEIIYRYPTARSKDDKGLSFVNIKDLNNDPFKIYLDEMALTAISESQKGPIIKDSVLLVSSIAPNPKPTYFKFQNQPIIVSPNIHVFKVKEEKVDVDYLIAQLSTEEFQNQMNAFAMGSTSLKRISAKDFLNLRIKLPAPEEQKEIIRIQKEGIYTRKIAEAQEFAKKSGITAKSEKELLGFAKHEIGNIAGGITNDIINLKSFITRKGIDFQEKVSGSKKAVNISKVFDRMQSNMEDIENLMTNIESIINIADIPIKKSYVNFTSFIRTQCYKVEGFKEMGIRLIFKGDGLTKSFSEEKVFVDENQFSVVIRNFVINSIKHGFTNNMSEKIIVFGLKMDEDFYYINMINNGEPLLENFTLEEYLKFGGRQSNQKGSGIGGFLIGKVIENHEGSIDIISNEKVIYILNDLNLFTLNDLDPFATKSKIALKPGVNFLIKLPKE